MIALEVIELDFAKIEFFENYVITSVHDNITIDKEHFALYKELFTAYFQERPYVYISNRAKGYTVNPIAYIHFEFSDILKGVAIVTSGKTKVSNAKFEKRFMAKPFRVFLTLEEAIQWANEICSNP
ncbi:hypothetical protein [Flavimarina sp. Hel_I_48]|uniref:hypothetical protein n=1 Tax=Flavimarina sp. Hel_I_48 TaxID=1392488 RepID=UPI0004DF9FA3|nr:hypothetical protein [Flavimarina sp. Hel_I_48]